MAKTAVLIRHNFEMAHRLPVLPGKCMNLHGHGWWAEITVEGPMDSNGVIVEYGRLKKSVREWIDAYLDHGTALGIDDPLIKALDEDPYHSKTFVFGADEDYPEFPWPTVEAIAHLLAETTQNLIDKTVGLSGLVTRVKVDETHVNSAIWTREEHDL